MKPAGDASYRDADQVSRRSDGHGHGQRVLSAEMVDWLPELVWTCQPDGGCDFLNQRWLQYTGVAAEAQYGLGWVEQVHPEDRATLSNAWRPPQRDPEEVRVALRLRRHDGAYRRFDLRVVPVSDARGALSKWLGLCTDVQDQWELREHLRSKTEQLERLFAAVPGLLCTLELRPDGSHRFPIVSPAVRDVTGFDPELLAQDASPVLSRVHEADRERYMASIAQSARSLSHWHCEFRYEHPTKGLLWLEGHSAPVAQPDGRILWHGVVTDTTQKHEERLERAAAEERAAARDRIGRALSQAASLAEGLSQLLQTLCQLEGWQFGAVWLQSPAGAPLHCVARWDEPGSMVALSPLLQATPLQLTTAEADELQTVLQSEKPWCATEAQQLAAHGGKRTQLMAAAGLNSALRCPLSQGSSLRAVIELASSRERPDTRPTLELIDALGSSVYLCMKRLNAEQALRKSELRMHSIIEHMSEGLVVSDPDMQVMHWNPAALELHGFTREEDWKKRLPEFQSIFELSTMDGRVLGFDEWPMPRILRGEKLRGCEVRIRRLDGDWQRVFGYGGSLVKQPDGRELSFLTITDLTERTRAVEQLQHLNQELERRVAQRTSELMHSNRELESFSYSVSHDLRSPLRAMNGYAEMLLEDFASELPSEAQRLLRVISDSGKRMGELIDDLLALSRMGRKELSVTRVDMRVLVDAVLADAQFPGQRDAHVSIGALPSCMGDPSLLKHVWINLLSNAFKYARRSAPIEVEVQGESTADGAASYSVRDNGAGFDMRYVHKLFGVFQRLHSDEEFEGTGVGQRRDRWT